MKKVLVIVAHADDEALGCGGTIAKHINDGDIVNLILMTDGVSSRGITLNKCKIKRAKALKLSASILGIKKTYQFNFPDNEMDKVSLLQVVKKIEKIIDSIKPQIIYTHSNTDLNIDHKVTANAVSIAVRPLPNSSIEEIYAMEVLSSSNWNLSSTSNNLFHPTKFIEITDTYEKKIEALNAYDLEMREFPHERSYKAIEHLVGLRGASVGVNMAEAFEVLKIINRNK